MVCILQFVDVGVKYMLLAFEVSIVIIGGFRDITATNEQ
tara:strand:+ start:487 stop:603 length:117 start_codon:yes stop_codon:yes gene_type:complete